MKKTTQDTTEREQRAKEVCQRLKGLPEGYIQHNFAVIDEARHKEISSKGGIKSGEARRKRAARDKATRTMLDYMFFPNYTEQDIEEFRKWQRHRRYLQQKREEKELKMIHYERVTHVNLKEASKITGINAGTLKRHIDKNLLYAEQAGKGCKYYIPLEALEEYAYYIYTHTNGINMYNPAATFRDRANFILYGIT